MNWLAKLNDDPLPWLLEPDPANPGVRYFALRDLLDRPTDDPELRQAQAEVMLTGPIRAILDAQAPDGYWDKPGAGYARQIYRHRLVGDLPGDVRRGWPRPGRAPRV